MGDVTPEKFKLKLEENDETREVEIKEILNSLNFKQFSIQVKPTFNDYNGERSMSYFAQRVYTFSAQKNNDLLIHRLKAYQRKLPDVMAD